MFSRWNQLQVTYRDPDGMGLPGQKGSEYQAYVELVRVSKTTGTWEKIASFDSNLQCAGGPSLCQADNTTKNFTVDFSHTFDFDNYAYARRLRAALSRAGHLQPDAGDLPAAPAGGTDRRAAGCHRSSGSGHRIRAGQSVTRRRSARRRLP